MPKFSIIMQCFLGDYKNAASKREEKLIRAVNSVLGQTFKDWELIIIADGCEKTFDLIEENYSKNSDIECYLIEKQVMWSGTPRNFGISKAKGDYILYLDADDIIGPKHLEIISNHIAGYDWVWFNDLVRFQDSIKERKCLITQRYQYGTSNLCHKRSINAKWTSTGYGHDDWGLGQHLLNISKNFSKITTPEYIVCHIPALKLDV